MNLYAVRRVDPDGTLRWFCIRDDDASVMEPSDWLHGNAIGAPPIDCLTVDIDDADNIAEQARANGYAATTEVKSFTLTAR